MKTPSLLFLFLELVLFILAFLLSFWPLVVCAIALAVGRGDWLPALCLAVFADVLYGPPTSTVSHTIAVPFTLATLGAVALSMLLLRQMRSDMPDVL